MKKEQGLILALGIIAVFMFTCLFLPSMMSAGSLEPSGPPGPTMKTLDEIPPTWSQKLPASERFVLVLDGEGVLDKETGLVWEQSPDDTITLPWSDALIHACEQEIGGRRGWRLPAIEELASLIDPNNTSPALPTGHPFTNVQNYYWSSTKSDYVLPGGPVDEYAWSVRFSSGSLTFYSKSAPSYIWCVRGGHGYDTY